LHAHGVNSSPSVSHGRESSATLAKTSSFSGLLKVQEATLHELVTVLRSVKHHQFLDLLLLSSLPDLFQGLVLTEFLHMQLNSSIMESLQNRMQ
jgi:hypothetical protein